MKNKFSLTKCWNGFLEFLANYQKPIILVCVILMIALPFLVTNVYIMRIATLCIINIVLGLSYNLVHGYMGQMSFATAAFWGIGAYTGAILITRFQVPSVIAMFCGMIVAGVFGLLVALPSLKLKGYYLSIVTMGFCEIVRLIELNWMSLTKGALGIMNIPAFTLFGIELSSSRANYFISCIILAITTIVVVNLVNSNFGLSLKAIRDDDAAAETMGINIVKVKRINFIISAMICGFVGSFYAQYVTFIHPSSFTSAISQENLVMVIFGGLGNIVGTFLGCISLTILPELLRDLLQYRLLIYGVLMVLLMNVKPTGIFGNVDFNLIRRISAEKKKAIKEEKMTPNERGASHGK